MCLNCFVGLDIMVEGGGKKTWLSFTLSWGSQVILEWLATAALTPWFNAPCAVSLFCTENDKQPICWSASKAEAAGVHALSFINEATCECQPGSSKEVHLFLSHLKMS